MISQIYAWFIGGMQTYTSKPIYRYTMFGVFSKRKRALHQWSTCILIVPCIYIYNVGITCFTARTQCFQEFYMCTFQRCCACVRDVVHVSEMWCTCQRCCARFPAVVHVSQKLCTFHKPPNNVRVQLYTHWAHSNQQKHWGDQTRSPDISLSLTRIVSPQRHPHI